MSAVARELSDTRQDCPGSEDLWKRKVAVIFKAQVCAGMAVVINVVHIEDRSNDCL